MRRHRDISADEMAQVITHADAWRDTETERGFSMALGRLGDPADGDCMLVRETTHRFSPLSFHRAMVGQTIPMLLTAAGRAYFAHCPETQREQLLHMIRAGDGVEARLAADDRFVARLVSNTRVLGFGSNDGEWTSQRKVGAIAVPIRPGGLPVAAVNIVYLNKLLTLKEAERRFLPALQRAAMRIETQLSDGPSPLAGPLPDPLPGNPAP